MPLALLNPLPLKIVVDSVLGSRPVPEWFAALLPRAVPDSGGAVLGAAVGLVLALALANQLQSLAILVLRTYVGERLLLAFRAQLFGRVQRLSFSYHDTKGSTDSVYRIQYDAPAIQWVMLDLSIPIVASLITLAAMAYVTLRIDSSIALIALAVAPFVAWASHHHRERFREQWSDLKQLESSIMTRVQEALGALRVVKAFGQEEREHHQFVKQSSAFVHARVRVSVLEGGLGVLVGLITALGSAAVIFVGVRHVQAGALTLGDFLLVMGYLTQIYTPLQTIGKSFTALQGAHASAERAFALLDEQSDVTERSGARPLARAAGAISFRHVTFAYDGERPVVRDVSFDIEPGRSLGVAGTTGAGKTTLMSLLTRFYDPVQGQILLDGIDIRDYRLADLRNQFAIALQEPTLFSTSIGENIAYARPGATEQEIIAAATAANAHEFIAKLPDGYDTLVGERGMRLSGGERQRIALARAFLKDAPVLILDEPTSSVDIQTEAVIMDAMRRLMAGRTSFIIAHRLSTLDYCDLRMDIADGRVVTVEARSPAVVAKNQA
jgi:ATP-binding cassette subfamily B protein